jgi:hypothetical protein
MDVTLPNGQVIRGVPEGTSKADLVAKLSRNGMDTSWYKPEEAAPAPVKRAPIPEQNLTLGEELASGADKIINKMGLSKAKDALVNYAQGASGLYRGAGNLISEGAGDRMFPKSGEAGSTGELVGQLTDPAAMVAGVKGAQLLGKVPGFAKAGYESVRGRGLVEGLKSLGKNVATGAAVGGGLGGLTDGGDAATGAAMGAVLPLAMGAGAGAGSFVKDAVGPLRESWRTGQMQKRMGEVLGSDKEAINQYIQQNAKPGQTVGDLVAQMNSGQGTATGAPLIAFENSLGGVDELATIAKTADATRQAGREARISRWAPGEEAVGQAASRRNEVTAPMREEVLTNANVAGRAPAYLQPALEASQGFLPLKPDAVASKLQRIRTAPGNKTNPTVQGAMDEVQSLIDGATNTKGNIGAEDLYTLRKQAGNVIKKYSQENKDWDERFTSGLLKDVQKVVDSSIEEASGNTGQWQRYLDVYGKRSRGIDQMNIGNDILSALRSPTGKERPTQAANYISKNAGELESTLSPRQQQDVQGLMQDITTNQTRKDLGSGVGTDKMFGATNSGQVRIPHLLSRTATITNTLLDFLGQGANQKVAKDAGVLMYTDPKAFASKYLADVPPAEASAVIKALRAGRVLQYPLVTSTSAEE